MVTVSNFLSLFNLSELKKLSLILFFFFFVLDSSEIVMAKNLPNFDLNKSLFISEEICGGETIYQYILVPQKEYAFNKIGEVGKDAYYKAFCLKNGNLDTDFGIKKIRWHYDFNNYLENASWTKFIPLGYGQLLLDEAETKIKNIKYIKVKKLNKLLNEALDAPAN